MGQRSRTICSARHHRRRGNSPGIVVQTAAETALEQSHLDQIEDHGHGGNAANGRHRNAGGAAKDTFPGIEDFMHGGLLSERGFMLRRGWQSTTVAFLCSLIWKRIYGRCCSATNDNFS